MTADLHSVAAEALEAVAAAPDLTALEAVRTNLASVGLGDEPATVVRAALPGWLAGAPAFDLALCDPPYTFDAWTELLSILRAETAVLESSAPVPLPEGASALPMQPGRAGDLDPEFDPAEIERLAQVIEMVGCATGDSNARPTAPEAVALSS